MLTGNLIKSMKDNHIPDTPEKEILTVFTLILVMKVCKINNPKITADEQQFICEQLLVRPLEEQKTCVQVQFIDQHYQKYR